MNTNLLIGGGGLLVGTALGFVVGGGVSGDSSEQTAGIQPSKTARPQVVSAEARRETVTELSEVFREPGQTARVQKMLDYYASLDPSMFEEEVAKLDELPFSERIIAAYLLFSQWAEVDPLAALEGTRQMGRGGAFVRPTVLQSWASTDPASAALYYQENPSEFAMMGGFGGGRGPGGGASGAGVIAGEWARQDPQAAWEWAQGLDGRDGTAAVQSVLQEVANEDPQAALVMAQNLSGDERTEAYVAIAGSWGRDDWEGLSAWASSLSGEEQVRVLEEGIRGYAERDPVAAAEASLAISNAEVRDEGIEESVGNWSRTDPEAAMTFLLENGSAEAQAGAMREAMGNLTREDPSLALSTLESLESGEARDRAVGSYIFNNADLEPTDAIDLASTIDDERDRARTIQRTAAAWYQEDQVAAEEFLSTTEFLDEGQIERIVSGRGFGGRGGRGGR